MEIRKEMVPDVMHDLLVLYMAGEASIATRAVVETYAIQDREFAALLGSTERSPLEVPEARDAAMEVLARTRKHLKMQKILFGIGLFTCLVPFTVVVRHAKIVFFMWRDAPTMALAFTAIGVLVWASYWTVGRQVSKAGL